MYKYYLGAFGNRSYICPQYEILENGLLREIGESRWDEFPNGGTVSLSNSYESETDNLKNRLLQFKIDFENDLHPTYDMYVENSNKYQIKHSAIEEFDREEIIEVIDIDFPIDEFLNDKTKRTIRIKHKPNKLILLRYAQDCYGPFEFMISDIEDSYGDETYYTLRIFVSSGTINTYKNSDLDRIIMPGNFSIRRIDKMEFIYKLEKLEEIEPADKIDYFDNEELADYLKNLLDKSDAIENVAEIREQFLQIADTFSEEGQPSDKKTQRICEILQTSVDLSDYKLKLIEEYFRNNPAASKDKEEYLRTHEELLRAVVKEDIQYEEVEKELKRDIETLKNSKDTLINKIEEEKEKLNNQQAEMAKLEEQAFTQKKQEIEEALSSQRKQLEDVQQAIENARKECEQRERDRDFWKQQCAKLQEECTTITNDINTKIIEWASENRNTEIIRLLVSQLEMPENGIEGTLPTAIQNLQNDLSGEQLSTILINKFAEAGRTINKDEAYNYLISIVQNYITVFAGEPGTGKTSLCKLMAKALGLYDDRFAEILVERGWTSTKDLIGYYNPLTKEIEKAQPKFSDCMRLLNAENREGLVEAPYLVLLDEANLSPIEYYWSNFNYYCDDPSHQVVSYANGEKYEFGSELKFMATINYDQTTADLSPRFLDRAWVISMNPVAIDTTFNGFVDDSEIKNNEEIISLAALNNVFDWHLFKEKKMNQITKNRIDRIVDKMKDGGHIISARSLKAIGHYYLVAEEYMSSKETALDYAVSQKILPCINGNGKKYGEFLKDLMNICKENQLNRSASILSKIIERSEHEFYGFFSI